ncbi:MAG: hypothetical protein HOV82_16890 [Streptomyces sp.]|nr:hypothetical protein [Streptomyces sp.]NUP36231.1 hypothetical protein [Streptomyces sp.]NUS75578.1 hypothetical protein [Streptomyces sp.]
MTRRLTVWALTALGPALTAAVLTAAVLPFHGTTRYALASMAAVALAAISGSLTPPRTNREDGSQ